MQYLIKFLNYIQEHPDPALGIIVIVGVFLCILFYSISMPTLCTIIATCVIALVVIGIAGFD